MTEMLRIFDETHKPIGIASRDEVHQVGYWHETFHCWVMEGDMIYFQIRSSHKKDYPGLFDITAAGHLLTDESVEDGVREIQEEIGLQTSFDELIPLGVIKNAIILDSITDLEFSHVFLYQGQNVMNRCLLEEDEVSGLVKTSFQSFHDLVHEKIDTIRVDGFIIDPLGVRHNMEQHIGISDFVPHDRNYLLEVTERIQKIVRIN
jgi:isopentenyldiphosphate isomerase